MKSILFLSSFVLISLVGCTQSKQKTDRVVGSACEACDLMFEGMPDDPSWQTTITGPDEPGEPLIISGIIYKKDGKTSRTGSYFIRLSH